MTSTHTFPIPSIKNNGLYFLKNEASNHTSKTAYLSSKIISLERKPSYDQVTLENAKKCILENITNADYKITQLARDTAYSQRQLTRIIKKLTGLSPVHFVLQVRLDKAYELLFNRSLHTVAQIREEVGIMHPSYFNRKFIEKFGIRPKELLAS